MEQEKLYSDKELNRIIRKAADLQLKEGDRNGQGSVFKGSLIWSSSPMEIYRSGVALKVEGTGTPEGTTVKIQLNLEQIAGGIFGGIVGGVGLGAGLGVGLGVGLGALNSPLFAGLFSSGAIVVSFLLSRLIFTLIGKNQENKLKKIAGFMKELLVKEGLALNTSLPDQ